MKKMITIGVCDVCGKEIDAAGSRPVVRMGIGNWKNDDVQWANDKELCRECYDAVVDLLKSEVKPEKVRSRKAPKSTSDDGEIVESKCGLGKSKYPLDALYDMFCDGYDNGYISKRLNIPIGSIGYYITKCKELGAERGQNKRPDVVEKPVQFRTVVDSSTGLVINVE